MSVTPRTPVAATFGYEVSDDINSNKSILKQCTEALVTNGVPVTLPGSFLAPTLSSNKSGTPYDVEIEWIKNIQAAMALTAASLDLLNGSSVKLIKIASKLLGDTGNSVTVAVAAGTVSGSKITVVKSTTTETYDNLADVDAAITALAGSALVNATKYTNGTLAVISATHLAGGKGAAYTAPTFVLGENDGQSIFIAKWARALFDGLRTAGYIN